MTLWTPEVVFPSGLHFLMCSNIIPSILVLDSDVQRRMQIRYTLSLHGYKVLEAANSQEASAVCSVEEITIDLILQDPGTQCAFKWPEWRPRVPVLALTTPEPHRQDSPDDFWRLPFDPETLLCQVRAAVAQSGSAPADRERTANQNTAQSEAGARGTVLIVEDGEFLRRAVSEMLRRSGFSVLEAADGGSAITLFADRAAQIDIVLLDMTLPVMSGREVFDAIEQIRPGVKVIFTTAHSEEMVMKSIWRRRPWAFVRKPYRPSDLVRLVAAAQIPEGEQQEGE